MIKGKWKDVTIEIGEFGTDPDLDVFDPRELNRLRAAAAFKDLGSKGKIKKLNAEIEKLTK